ncbi:chemotaxis response regulator protein-glutamate methylesterase [Mangrovimicrobium sediminis]|uniref:Protein-glutamate methylesterase/protein-glutamine glutaminase n=1 Tax=Mangrovimicrobium sediminis TaxID=2562682 RepID=A0A4Z0M7U1_9GAMM|nr:chemotaxis response regulator protein-glutamate methylesterase [Haliea sp. SAOS-164]TGD75468.1 chemotaxis response regulator protein-glutamate methylesterase [Haliea sp. SAOS-164]
MELKSLKTLKVLVVDDSLLYRDVVGHVVNDIGGAVVVGKAINGKQALEMIESLQPDVVTLDVEMPVMDGIAALGEMRKRFPKVQVLMVSSLTKAGAAVTVDALRKGAMDFICKPDTGSIGENQKVLVQQLGEKLRPLLHRHQVRAAAAERPQTAARAQTASKIAVPTRVLKAPSARIQLVAIGTSTGGPNALSEVLGKLPANLRVPVVVVQHMPELFTAELAKSLNRNCALEISEAVDGEPLQAGHVYIAPGGKQMKLRDKGGQGQVVITDDPAEHFCKPAVNYLFRSVAQVYKQNALGVILTGMGSDGADGLAAMKQAGATSLAQDEETSVVFGMPKEAISKGVVDAVLPLQKVAPKILELVN